MKTKLYYFAYGFIIGIRMIWGYSPSERSEAFRFMPVFAAESFLWGEVVGSFTFAMFCLFSGIITIFFIWGII